MASNCDSSSISKFEVSLSENTNKKKVILAVTGSVATIRLVPLIQELEENLDVDLVVLATNNALNFIKLKDIPSHVKVFTDESDWKTWSKVGDPVLHIELRRWADMIVIAPLDANTMAKMANGICDNLLTCVVRAWDLSKPLLFCPAMNTHMWNHPMTARHVETLRSFGYIEVPCVSKKLACGDEGIGGMAKLPSIIEAVKNVLGCS